MISKFKENLKKILRCLIFTIFGLALLISLLSSSPGDNTFLKFDSTIYKSGNSFGYLGSILADFFLKIFGQISYVFCLFFFINAFRILKGKEFSWYSWTFLPFSVVFLCFLFNFLSEQFPNFQISSGILGSGLNFYFDYFFKGSEYLEIILLTIILLLLISLLLTFNYGYKDIQNVLSFLINNLKEFIIMPLRILNLFKKNKIIPQPTISKKRKEIFSNNIKQVTNQEITNVNYVFPSMELLNA